MLTTEKTQIPPVEVRLLGGFDFRIDGKSLPPLRSRREHWLLVLLVLRQDRDTDREWLATTLWPDNDEKQALFYLRKSLSNLRQALGTEASRLLSPTPRTVRLDMTGAFVDVVSFDGALKKASSAADPSIPLQEAVALYRGPLLPDNLEEWATVERDQRAQAYLSALESLSTHFYAQGEAATAVHWLRLLTAADPYRESAYVSLMQALAACGDSAAITVVYQELRSRLRQELNATPAPETEALYRKLRRQERPAVSQQATPSAPSETRRHLPVPLSELIGRDNEITEVLSWLKRRRLITLLGAGGIGKTRLAIAVAEAAMPQFEQGVWFVDLAALSDPALVPQATAKALGITEQPGRPLSETLVEVLSERSLLLVLDNCEHLLEACADLAYHLLYACPALSIIATSRQALSVMGEQVYRVPSLLVPPHQDETSTSLEKDPHFLMEYEAVRLFVERAIRVNSGFRLNSRNASSVVEICRQLDGIPLAIEMAAARLRSLSVSEVNARLEDRFRLLTSGNRGVLPRQQTLRAAIDWSYDLLSEEERTLLCHLSVFAGGWTAETAESVCGNGEQDIQDALAALVDKSLVQRKEESEESIRYGMLETIRQYGGEHLAADSKLTEIRRRHRDYFLTLAETTRAKVSGPERIQTLAILDAEHDNLRQALAFCREQAEPGELGLRLSASLWGFWLARDHISEGRDHFTSALSHPEAQTHSKARSDALNGAGVMAFFQGDYASSLSLHEEGLAICRALGERKGIAFALSNMGNVAATQGDFASARALYEESLTIQRELGENLANLLNNLGNIAKEQGDYEAARALQEEGLEIERASGNRQGVAGTLNNLGILAEVLGNYTTARALLEESLAIHRELGPRYAEASNLAELGNVALYEGDYRTARAFYEESLTIRREVGDRWGVAISIHGLGLAAFHQGDYPAARAFYVESLTMLQSMEDHWGIARALGTIATLARHEEHYERAARLWGAASALRENIGAAVAPNLRDELEREIAATREVLGEAEFVAAWEEGRAMVLESAIEYALEK